MAIFGKEIQNILETAVQTSVQNRTTLLRIVQKIHTVVQYSMLRLNSSLKKKKFWHCSPCTGVCTIDYSELGLDGRGSCYNHMMAFQKHTHTGAEMKRAMDGLNFLPDALFVYNKNSAVRESRGLN